MTSLNSGLNQQLMPTFQHFMQEHYNSLAICKERRFFSKPLQEIFSHGHTHSMIGGTGRVIILQCNLQGGMYELNHQLPRPICKINRKFKPSRSNLNQPWFANRRTRGTVTQKRNQTRAEPQGHQDMNI
jgi:hypothetical protein